MSDYPCGGLRQEQDLMLYVGGELSAGEKRRVAAHLRECPHCRQQQHLLTQAMQSVAAEVRGSGLPRWTPPGMVSAAAVSTRLRGQPWNPGRLAALAAISAAVAVLTSYMAAAYGDHLRLAPFTPLSRVSTAIPATPIPPCESSPAASANKPCHNCASAVPALPR